MEILFCVIILISFIMLVFSLEQIAKIKAAYSPAVALCIIVIFIYLGGLLHMLKWSAILVVTISYICGFASLILFIKKGNKFKIPPCHVFLLVMSILTFVECFLEKKVFVTPDDMTVWALSFMVMKTENILYSFVDIGQSHFSYPPAAQLIWYYFSLGQNVIHEWFIFAINNCSWYVFLATAFYKINQLEISRRRIKKCFLMGTIIVCSVSCFNDLLPYSACLFVEPMMLVIFGAMLIIYFADEEFVKRNTIALVPLGVILALTKDTGLVLLACFCLITVVSSVIFAIQKRINLKNFFSNVGKISFIGIGGLGFWFLWNITGKFSEHGNALQRTAESTEINTQLLDKEMIRDIFKNFFQALNTESIAWATCLIVLCSICIIIYFTFKFILQYRAENIVGGITVGFLAQCAVLLFLYIHVFSPEEALVHAEMERYLSPYLGGALIFAIAIVGTEWVEFEKRERGKGFLVIQLWTVLCVLVIKSVNLIYTPFYVEDYKADTVYDDIRTIVHNNSDEIKEKLSTDDIIYVVAQGDCRNGKTATIAIASVYEYYPYYIVPNCDTSFKLPVEGWEDIKKNATRYQSEYFTTYLTPEEWMHYLYEKGVTKILVIPSSQEMEPEFQILFEDGLEGIMTDDSARLYDVNGYEFLPFKRVY